MTNFIEALKQANSAAKTIEDAYEAFDNAAYLQPWKGNSHEDLMGLFDDLGAFLRTLTAELIQDLNDTPPRPTTDTRPFTPELHITAALALTSLITTYMNITADQLEITNHELREIVWGKTSSPDAPHEYHRTAHNTLCEALTVYPHMMTTLGLHEFTERNKRIREAGTLQKELQEARKKADTLAKENRQLKNRLANKNPAVDEE